MKPAPVPEDNDSTAICKADLPPDERNHTFNAHLHQTEDDFWNDPELAAIFKRAFPNGWRKPGTVSACPVEREAQRDEEAKEREHAALKIAAAEYAQSCLGALSPAQRIEAAAPAARRVRKRMAAQFPWHAPKIMESRHGPYLAWDGNGALFNVAIANGKSTGFAQDVRIEITFAKLLADEPLIWSARDSRGKRIGSEDNVMIGAMLRTFWAANEEAMAIAEQQKVWRLQPPPTFEGKAQLAVEVLARITDTRTSNQRQPARAALLAVCSVVDSFKREMEKVG